MWVWKNKRNETLVKIRKLVNFVENKLAEQRGLSHAETIVLAELTADVVKSMLRESEPTG